MFFNARCFCQGAVTTWVVADADTVVGRRLISSALNFIVSFLLILCSESVASSAEGLILLLLYFVEVFSRYSKGIVC